MMRIRSRSFCEVLIAAALGFALAGCGSQQEAVAPVVKVHSAGESVEAGLIRYTVGGTEWKDRLGEGSNSVVPAHRFLVVKLSMFNRSSDDQVVPPLALVDAEGRMYPEASGLEAEPQWLGLVRKVPGNDSRQAIAVFDVLPGRYNLRLADNTDQGRDALIELPAGISQ